MWIFCFSGKDLLPGGTQAFSSYPGSIFSGDDFYILSSGLVRTLCTWHEWKNKLQRLNVVVILLLVTNWVTLHGVSCSYSISCLQVTLETTIGNSNPALWKFVQPTGSVMEWLRNIVANRLAATGKDWAKIFSKYNSGTWVWHTRKKLALMTFYYHHFVLT